MSKILFSSFIFNFSFKMGRKCIVSVCKSGFATSTDKFPIPPGSTVDEMLKNWPRTSRVFRNLLNFETPPTKVLEEKPDTYSLRDVCYREDGLVLYEPTKNSKKEKLQYEIVLHRPYTESNDSAFSLYRSVTKEDAEVRFITYKDKVSVFVDANKELCTANGLQKICDELTKHPTWTLAHLAAHLGLSESFNNPIISNFLNSSDSATGMSPLQVAVSSSNLKVVELLVNAQSSLEHLDHNDNSVFHYASSTNKDIILALNRGSARCLNSRNKTGLTPLHMACIANKPDCVKALLVAGADVNITCSQTSSVDGPPGFVGDFMQDHPNKLYHQDMKFGGTPLHWSCSREVIESLIQKNCNINALNFDHRSALHIMVLRNRLECVVALLSNGADPDIGDMNGNTPLHLAVKEGNASIIQSLIVFGAKLNLLNNDGATARHLITPEQAPKILYYLHAVGAERCAEDMVGCSDACKCDGTNCGIPPPPISGPANRDILNQMLDVAGMEVCAEKHRGNRRPKGGRLLCLDGGGIRGLILVQMLLELQKVVDKPIVHCFDWISGTSTGGILALGLACGKNLNEILCLYFRMKEHTFIGIRPYPSEALENILKDCFGSETVMADIKTPKMLITGVLADRKPVDLHLFRNYESPSDILDIKQDSPYQLPPPPEEQLIWEVGRATGAAPSYFRAFNHYLDGGLIANNPTLDALTEIHEYNLALRAKNRDEEIEPLKVLVSLGTGVVPVTQLKDIDVFRPESIWDSAKVVIGITKIGALLVDQATMSDGRVVDRARAWCSMTGIPYYRYSPQMSEEIVMDEKSDEKLVKMLWEAKVYMHENLDSMKELAVLLNN